MSKKKKQTVTILVLCVVLLALGVAYIFASKYQKSKDETETTDESTVLYQLKEDNITKLHFTNEKSDLTFVKDGEDWKLENDTEFPVDQTKLTTMVGDVASVTASQTITEDCTDLSEYELDAPVLSVEVTDKDGTVKTITYGMESAAAEGCYAYTEDTKKIYVVPSNVTSDFDFTQSQLMVVPDSPDISEEYVTSYAIDKKKGRDFTATYDKDNAKYKDIYGWDITKAYSQTVAGDQDGLQTVFSSLSSVEYTEGVVYNATEKELKQYGISTPNYRLHVKYYTVKSDDSADTTTDTSEVAESDKEYHDFELLVGNMDDLQQNYYVQPSNDKGIYLVSVDTMNSLVDFDAFSCVYKTPCPANTDALQSITLTYGGKTYEMTLSKEEKPSTSSDTEYNYTATIDGKEVDDKKFREAYETLGSLVYSAKIKDSVTAVSDKPVATITFKEDDRTSTVKFIPYDGNNFYRVDVDGVCMFTVDMTTVDSYLKKFVDLTK